MALKRTAKGYTIDISGTGRSPAGLGIEATNSQTCLPNRIGMPFDGLSNRPIRPPNLDPTRDLRAQPPRQSDLSMHSLDHPPKI